MKYKNFENIKAQNMDFYLLILLAKKSFPTHQLRLQGYV